MRTCVSTPNDLNALESMDERDFADFHRAGGVYVDQVSLFDGDEMGLGKRTVDVNIDAKVRI